MLLHTILAGCACKTEWLLNYMRSLNNRFCCGSSTLQITSFDYYREPKFIAISFLYIILTTAFMMLDVC